MVDPQIVPHNKHIAIKYHNFQSFVANSDAETKNIADKEHITDIFTKLLYPWLFGCLRYTINGW